MISYYILFLLIFIIIAIPVPKKYNDIRLSIPFILIFIYSSIRVGGFDYESYEIFFDDVHSYKQIYSVNERMEIGYLYLNKILPSFRILLILLSAFTSYTYYVLFKKYITPKYYLFGFVLMALFNEQMLLFQLSGLRNAIAINIMFLSIPFIIERKILKYLGLTLFASLFHTSSLLYMPLTYLTVSGKEFKKRDLYIWILSFILLLFISSTGLIKFLTPYIDLYFPKYYVYTDLALESIYNRSFLLYGFVVIVVAFTFNTLMTNKRITSYEIIFLKLSLLYNVSIVLGTLNYRMSQYYAPYLLLSTIIVYEKSQNKQIKYLYPIVLISYLLYLLFIYSTRSQEFIYDYHTIFE